MMTIENQELSLSPTQWQVADAIAYQLAQEQLTINAKSGSNSDGLLTEFKKVIAYLRDLNTQADLFEYLDIWIKNGRDAGHGNNIVKYYKAMQEICQSRLESYQNQPQVLLEILGWAARLSKYYKLNPDAESPYSSANFVPEAQQLRQQKVSRFVESNNLEVGQQLEATVLKKKKKGSYVTYEIAGVSYKEKEPRNFDIIPDQGLVLVEIKSFKDMGDNNAKGINHVKFVKVIN